MKFDKLVHIIEKSNTITICNKSIKEEYLHYKWMHPFEAFKKKLIIHNEKDMPTCPLCLNIVMLGRIEIIKEYK